MIEFESNEELQRIVDRQISTLAEFSAIRVGQVTVKAWLKIKTDPEGEPVQSTGVPVKLRKLDSLARALSVGASEVPIDYTLTIDGYKWINFPAERDPLVHFGLMHIQIETDEEGNVKRKTKKPDVVEFTETLNRFGPWNSILSQIAPMLQRTSPAVAAQLEEEI